MCYYMLRGDIMKVQFTLKLVGGDTMTAPFDTQADDWEKFYSTLKSLKTSYKNSVNSVRKSSSKKSGGNDKILSRAKDADSKPLSDKQRGILLKAGYSDKELFGLTVADAAPLVKEALAKLNGGQI